MGDPIELKNAAKTWQTMVDSNRALLVRKSGHDAHWWAERGREAGRRKRTAWRSSSGRATSPSTRRGGNLPRSHGPTTPAWTSRFGWTLRLDAPADGRLTAVKVRDGDFFDRKVRLTSVDEVDDGALGILAQALHQNS